MNISFKSYIDIFNFISKVFAMSILGKETALYRYENLIVHDQTWPLTGKFTICRRYVMKINNLRDGNLNQYDDASINIITYRREKTELCSEPYVVAYYPLFADKPLNINIFVDVKFFRDTTFEEPNESVIIDRVSYTKMILDKIAKIFYEDNEEIDEIFNNLNSVLAYCIFTDKLVDKDISDLSNKILNYTCAPGLDYVYINDIDALYNMISGVYCLRPEPKLINKEDKSLE